MTARRSAQRRHSGRPPAGEANARDALLRVAATRFSQDGYAGVSTRAILADADASAPALYHHFGSKTGLYVAVATAAQQHVLDQFAQAIAPHGEVVDKVSAILGAVILLRREHPNAARLFQTVQHDVRRYPELRALRRYDDHFTDFWASVVGPAATEGLALGLRAIVEGLLSVGGAAAKDADFDAAADAVVTMLRVGLPGLQRRELVGSERRRRRDAQGYR